MATYPNGKIPDRLLVRRGVLLLTAGTWAKFDDLVARVKKSHNVTLRITEGSGVMRGVGAYRSYAMQVAVKNYYISIGQSRMASSAGHSSHGGEFHGADALAVDITNYYLIPRADFFAAARAAGFNANYFDGRDGTPDEPWHLIDFDPFRNVPGTTGAGATGSEPKPNTNPTTIEEEENDMPKNSGVWYKKDKSTYVYMVFNTGSGFAHEFSNGTNAGTMPGTYTAALKVSMDIAGWSEVTLGHANVIKSALAQVRPKDAPKDIEVTIVSKAELDALGDAA